MLKHKKKQIKLPLRSKRSLKPMHDDLYVDKEEIKQSDFEYGDTNDLFEENLRETTEESY
ncbi:MAG TPA: hypothetical protein VK791_06040 [bacterium]|jgi:hypothetical protein|nr:hypothetical protein [bacterium]